MIYSAISLKGMKKIKNIKFLSNFSLQGFVVDVSEIMQNT